MRWRPEHLRLTVFCPRSAELGGAIWSTISQEPPDQIQDLPKQGVSIRTATQSFSTSGESFVLALSTAEGRVDLVFQPSPSTGGMPDADFPIICDSLDDSLTFLSSLGSKIFPCTTDVQRIAVGGVFTAKTSSKKEGYDALSNLLPIQPLDADKTSEFSFQINLPIKSGTVNGLVINRLTKWSSARRVTLMVSMTGGEAKQLPTEEFAVRSELDINTAPENNDSLDQQSVALMSELLSVLKERLVNGGRP